MDAAIGNATLIKKVIQSLEAKIQAIDKKLETEFEGIPVAQKHASVVFLQYLKEKEQLNKQRTTIEEKELFLIKQSALKTGKKTQPSNYQQRAKLRDRNVSYDDLTFFYII